MDEYRYKKDLWAQLKDINGKIVYTYVTHQKQLWLITLMQDIIGWIQIILTAISSVGLFNIIISNQITSAWLAGICSALSLAFNLYNRSAKMGDLISRHQKTVDALWPIVQDYTSLLTDFWYNAEIEEIKAKRQELQIRTNTVYREAPRTGKIAYIMAQRALKKNGEQSFTSKESDILLPESLRNRK